MNVSIESPANPKIKELVKLRESPRRRKQRGVFFVEGEEDLLALARAGREIEEIYFCRNTQSGREQNGALEEFRALGVEIIETAEVAFSKASYRSANHGVIGVVHAWELTLKKDMIKGRGPLVVLDEVEKPGNLGAILRSVEAFGGAGIILADPSVDVFNPNVVRSSRGLMGRVPLAVGSKEEVCKWLQSSGRVIFATSSRASQYLGEVELPSSSAFIFGSEKSGLGKFWQDQAIEWIKIPMKGSASSLNLNVSVACLLYESNRAGE